MSDNVFDFTKAHELLVLKLRFARQLPRKSVVCEAVKLNFVWDDEDFGYLPRQDKVEPWQASSICHFDLIEADSPTFCAGITFEFLFSALPSDCQSVFLETLSKLQILFGGHIEYDNKVLTMQQVLELFQQCTLDLHDEFAETAGSEFLQRLILEFRYNQKAF